MRSWDKLRVQLQHSSRNKVKDALQPKPRWSATADQSISCFSLIYTWNESVQGFDSSLWKVLYLAFCSDLCVTPVLLVKVLLKAHEPHCFLNVFSFSSQRRWFFHPPLTRHLVSLQRNCNHELWRNVPPSERCNYLQICSGVAQRLANIFKCHS